MITDEARTLQEARRNQTQAYESNKKGEQVNEHTKHSRQQHKQGSIRVTNMTRKQAAGLADWLATKSPPSRHMEALAYQTTSKHSRK